MRGISTRKLVGAVAVAFTFMLVFESQFGGSPAVFARECANDTGYCQSYAAPTYNSDQDRVKIFSIAQKVTTDGGPAAVFFSDTGHFIPNPILHYWRANGSLDRFGSPLSASFLDNQGNVVQFFQKMALAYHPQQAGKNAAGVSLYPLGSLYLASQPTWVQKVAPFAQVPALAPNIKNQKFFPQTGHKISFGLLDYYNTTGGQDTWGAPLSEEYNLIGSDGKSYTAQLFEQGRMLWSVATGVITDTGFMQEVAKTSGVRLDPEINLDPTTGKNVAPIYSSWLWPHWVDVSLNRESETFYEGDVAVRTSLVTTGTAANPTPVGNFHIFRLVPNEHMKNGKPGDPDYYDLKNVLYTMYFTPDGDALHYAWWRSVFGEVGSHGCVNEDLDTSLFAWNFLKVGSAVNVHY